MPKVTVADCAGACYGVERALSLVRKAADGTKPVATLGPLIHNPQVVTQLEARGVRVAESLDEAEGATVVIRSHGVPKPVVDEAHERGLEVVDATCPHVAKAHRAARELAEQGYYVIVVGEEGHPEVEGICSYAGERCLVVDSARQIPTPLPAARIGVVVQTTQRPEALEEVAAYLASHAHDLRVLNTICQATQQRQDAARRLAAASDVMVVVGGRNSGNTTRLAQICAAECPATHHIEVADEIDAAWFAPGAQVGVTAGASTPLEQIEAVVARIEAL